MWVRVPDGGGELSEEEEASDGEVLSTEIPEPARADRAQNQRRRGGSASCWKRETLRWRCGTWNRAPEAAVAPDEGNERECLVVAR